MHPRKYAVVVLLECRGEQPPAAVGPPRNTQEGPQLPRRSAIRATYAVHARLPSPQPTTRRNPRRHDEQRGREKRVCTRVSAPSWTWLSDEGGACEAPPFIAQEGPRQKLGRVLRDALTPCTPASLPLLLAKARAGCSPAEVERVGFISRTQRTRRASTRRTIRLLFLQLRREHPPVPSAHREREGKKEAGVHPRK